MFIELEDDFDEEEDEAFIAAGGTEFVMTGGDGVGELRAPRELPLPSVRKNQERWV